MAGRRCSAGRAITTTTSSRTTAERSISASATTTWSPRPGAQGGADRQASNAGAPASVPAARRASSTPRRRKQAGHVRRHRPRARPAGHRSLRGRPNAIRPILQRARHARQAGVPEIDAKARPPRARTREKALAVRAGIPVGVDRSVSAVYHAVARPASSTGPCSSSSPTTGSSTASIGFSKGRCCHTRRRCISRW